LCAIALSGAALLHERRERFRTFDVMLRGRADSLLGAVQDAEDPGDNVMVDQTELALPPEDAYAVIDVSGRILGRSPLWDGSFRVPPANGYTNQRAHGEHYRVLRTDGVRVIDREEHGGIRRPVVLVYATPTKQLWHSIFEAVRFYVFSSLLLLALTGIALAWLLRRGLSPLRDLAQEAGKVSAQSWHFQPSPDVLRTKELKPLAASITQLLRGLKESFAQQRRFTSDAAHELKTALAVIKSSLQLLTMRRRTNEEYGVGLDRLRADTARMEELVSRMLVLGRADERQDGSFAHSDLGHSLKRAAAQLEPLANMRQVEIAISAPAGVSVALSEEDGETLCSNLLANAVQHSQAQSRVTAAVRLAMGNVELTVTDQGEGIPEHALSHVFERFYRADSSRARETGGAGLGLSICKAIVGNSKGTIHINSGQDRGTEVSVIFPSQNGA
jgi:signal transduction histidine kinase